MPLEFRFVCICRQYLHRTIIYQCPSIFSITGISRFVHNTDCTREANESGKRAHIQRNIHFTVVKHHIPYTCHLLGCNWEGVFFGLGLFLSNLCQPSDPIFTPLTDSCFPAFLLPTLSQSILPVLIHKLCPLHSWLPFALSLSCPPFSHSLPQVLSDCRCINILLFIIIYNIIIYFPSCSS